MTNKEWADLDIASKRAHWRVWSMRRRARMTAEQLEAERARCRVYGKTRRGTTRASRALKPPWWLPLLFLPLIACRPVDYEESDVHDVSRPHDALRVYHDNYRGVTCYAGSHTSVTCLPDLWLRCNGGNCR
jgi:hypothetical protein